MFDLWLGSVDPTTLIVVLSLGVALPVQLLLCFRAKSRLFRLLPAVLFALLAAGFCLRLFAATGWEVLGWLFLAVFAAALLLACGLGWVIWAVVCHLKKHKT